MYTYSIKPLLSVALVLMVFVSCNNSWEEHYGNAHEVKGTQTLYQLISNEPTLSTFASMLASTGFDTLLSKPITYTVWAPKNSFSLDSIAALNDPQKNREIVMNHIGRFAYPTSGLTSKSIFLLNNKFIPFQRNANGFTFGGKLLITNQSNLAAQNGILHVIDSHVPYLSNLWEFILKTPHLDSLRHFLDSRSIYAFDPAASTEIGTNEFGQAIYDSIITFSNDILDRIGALHLEDSTYSVLLPNNQAWRKAYNDVKDKYRVLLSEGGSIRQRLLTQQALVENIVFRTLSPALQDSIVSTTGTIFRKPGYLFVNSAKSTLSNGTAYVTDSLRFKLSDSWQKNIIVEAENSEFGRSSLFSNLFIRSGLGTPFSQVISDTRFLLIEPTTVTTTQPASVTFPIPNTLSGKYRIFCVFVPSSVVNANDNRPYRVRFYVTHRNNAGVLVENSPISATHQLLPTNRTAAIFPTTGGVVSKMFITEFEFPFSNIVEPGAATTAITTRIRVENATTPLEDIQNRGDRRMRIDYIILEPVQ